MQHDHIHEQTETLTALERVRAAQALVKQDRARGLNALNAIFREGALPDPALDGHLAGEMVALDLAPVLTPLLNRLLAAWLPWKGKTFDSTSQRGDNIFQRSSYALAHVFWPLYRGYVDDTPDTYRAFVFRTYVAPGLQDPDRDVLKIDYDLTGNPKLSIRRVLDELVQVGDGYYLGKAHVQWWWGRWQMVVYFSLRQP